MSQGGRLASGQREAEVREGRECCRRRAGAWRDRPGSRSYSGEAWREQQTVTRSHIFAPDCLPTGLRLCLASLLLVGFSREVASCYTKPNVYEDDVCADLADKCEEHFCSTCGFAGKCDTTCGFCSISTTSTVTTMTTTTSSTTATTTTTCYSKNLKDDAWCDARKSFCEFEFCHDSSCTWLGQCDTTCGYCSTTTTTTSSTVTSTSSTTTTTTTSSTLTSTTETSTATTVTSTTTISTTTSETSTTTRTTRTTTRTTATQTVTSTTFTGTTLAMTTTLMSEDGATTEMTTSGPIDDSTTGEDGGIDHTTVVDKSAGTTTAFGGETTVTMSSTLTGTLEDDNVTDPASPIDIEGSFTLVLNGSTTTEEFCANTEALLAVQAALAEVANVEAAEVSLNCAASAARRRLIEANLRVLSVAVDISYVIQAALQSSLEALESLTEASLEALLVDRLAASDLDFSVAGVLAAAVGVVQEASTTTTTSTLTTTVVATTTTVPPSLAQQAEDLVTTGAGIGWALVPILIAVFCIVCWGSYCLVCGRRGMMPKLPRTPSKMSQASSSAVPASGYSTEGMRTDGGSTFPIPTSNSRNGISPYRVDAQGQDLYSNRPNRSLDETSESTLATSASACWRANMAQRKMPIVNDINDRTSRAVERTREFDPVRPGQGLSPGNVYLGRYFGRWVRRGSPDFGAEIRGDTIRFNNGIEKHISLGEDGSLEVEALNGEFCRGRLVGDELLWDDGDMWSRARGNDGNWLNSSFSRDFGETPGSRLLGEDMDQRGGGFGCCDPPLVPPEGRYQGDPYGDGDVDLFDLLPCGGEAPNNGRQQRASERCLFSC